MSTLHLITSARAHLPEQVPVADGDAVLLIEDGTLLAMREHPVISAWTRARCLWVLSADIKARGLEPLIPEAVQQTDYDGLVRLTEIHEKVITW